MRDPVTGETIPTELDGAAPGRGIERVVVVGLATDYCVKATALDAVRLGFATHRPDRRDRRGRPASRATASAAIEEMRDAGRRDRGRRRMR